MEENDSNNLESPFLSNSLDSNSNNRYSINKVNTSNNSIQENNTHININIYPNRNTVSPNEFFSSSIKPNIFDSRKTYNQPNNKQKEPLFKKRITEFLLKTSQKNKNIKDKELPKDLKNIFYDGEEDEESEEIEDDAIDENNL